MQRICVQKLAIYLKSFCDFLNAFTSLVTRPKDYKKESEAWSEDSMHTMDLYRLYKEEEDAKISKSAISREQRDQ